MFVVKRNRATFLLIFFNMFCLSIFISASFLSYIVRRLLFYSFFLFFSIIFFYICLFVVF